jgi:uncharacterized protein
MAEQETEKTYKNFSKDVLEKMDARDVNKYYVYGLFNPFDRGVNLKNLDYTKAFYIGKGCGNRVFQHAKNAIKPDKSEDEISLKTEIIRDILAKGEKVITAIYRWGLTEREALIVEAVLIDCVPDLTNIQSGYGTGDYGKSTTDDLIKLLKSKEYDEPKENYVIIKTTQNRVNAIMAEAKQKNKPISIEDARYEATRSAWRAKLSKAKEIKYVLSVIDGTVRAVYEATKWDEHPTRSKRIMFEGIPTTNSEMCKLIGLRIPQKYRNFGSANPFMYKK